MCSRVYYPWGESKSGNNPADIWSYATYWRDSFTGLDYANQRYYSNVQGRFMTVDQGQPRPRDPRSWNRYAYTRGDPTNRYDPKGRTDCVPVYGDFCVETDVIIVEYPDDSDGFATYIQNQIANGLNTATASLASLAADLNMSLNDRLSAAEAQVKQDLSNPACAKDFKNVGADVTKLGQIKTSAMGDPAFHTENGVIVTNTNSPPLGQYNALTRSITINSSINWGLPGLQQATLDGQPYFTNLLAGEANYLNVASINPAQLLDMTILHELSHYNGAIGNPDNQSVEQQLWQDCIK